MYFLVHLGRSVKLGPFVVYDHETTICGMVLVMRPASLDPLKYLKCFYELKEQEKGKKKEND